MNITNLLFAIKQACLSGNGDGIDSDTFNAPAGTVKLGKSGATTTITGTMKVDTITEDTSGNGVVIDSLTIKDSGVLSASATAGIGYGTGAGGAVSQDTNKGTGVTLNTVTGTITMDNADLLAAAEVTFTVTNSTVAVTDSVALSIQSGGTSGEYMASVSTVTAGSFDITLANMTGGTLGDVVLINFAVIKGVVA